MAPVLASILQRTRQHHAIEHATIHVLAARFPQAALAGLSDPWGFTLYGNVSREEIERAVSEALLRLQAGEVELSLHPNCGTNLTTSIVLATTAGLLGSAGHGRSVLDRLTTTATLITLALLVAQPLGMRLQRYTTSPFVADRWLADIRPLLESSSQAHRVVFA